MHLALEAKNRRRHDWRFRDTRVGLVPRFGGNIKIGFNFIEGGGVGGLEATPPNLRSGPILAFLIILSNGYRKNRAWYNLSNICARYGQILAVTPIGC